MSMQGATHKLFIQMSGAPGSGKSTMARLLGNSISEVVLDHDILRSTILLESDISFDLAAKAAYKLQWRQAEDFVRQGFNIIDSTCNFPKLLHQGSELSKQRDYTYWYVDGEVLDVDLPTG